MKTPATSKRDELLLKRETLVRELPHLYGFKFYRWQRAFFETRNKRAILTAANQIGKSSVQIRKMIHWATATNLWKSLWPLSPIPREFWYLYPSYDLATTEFQNKWVPEFLPKRGGYIKERFKEECLDPIYGWKAIYKKKLIHSLEFRNGLVLYFKAYTQNVHHLQAGSVHYIGTDEELPEELYDELIFRLKATHGYFSMVFTATRNQLLWMLTMEGEGEMEKFPDAFKMQISMYDCQVFEDGSPGRFSLADIKDAESDCKSQTEIERRVMGRFVTEVGRKYGAFVPTVHFIKPFPIPKDWLYYGGVDPGTGGEDAHPTGMGIIAVRPDFRYGVVCRGWRGDKVDTTSADVLDAYLKMKGDLHTTQQVYDSAARDFYLVASRNSENFLKVDKSHELGEDVVNMLFKKKALFIFDEPELRKLGIELMTLLRNTHKKRAKDDFIDGAIRYPATVIPWDFTFLKGVKSEIEIVKEKEEKTRKLPTEAELLAEQIRQRRGEVRRDDDENWADFNSTISEWNSMYS